MGKKIDTKVEKKVANWEHWKFSITDMDDAGKLALDLHPVSSEMNSWRSRLEN